jgi:uncharacterized protein (TIGR02996 family)
MAKAKDVWTKEHVKSLAPDAASIPAAEKVLKKGGFGTVEATADGRGWWVVCRGLSGTYQVTVRRDEGDEGDEGDYDCTCNCLSYKNPCKHALALLLYLVEHPELRAEVEAPKVAASDFEGLLRGAFRDPKADLPRLVFADYLEENDQPDRAALIRYQCERARLKPKTKRAKELDKLIKPLVAKLKQQIGPLPEGMAYKFVRGFVRLDAHLLHFSDIGSFPIRLMNLFRDGWIESLVTNIAYRWETDMLPFATQVGELDVSMSALTDELLVGVVADTAAARATGRLSRLTVHSRNRKELTKLLRAERGEEIDSADLAPTRDYTNLDDTTFRQLLQFGRFSGARNLSLHTRFSDLSEAEAAGLITADLSDLRQLHLYGWKLTRTAVETLVKGPALSKLTALQLQACGVTGGGVSALVSGPLFANLKTLDLSWNRIGKLGVAALMKAAVPEKLKILLLVGCQLQSDERRKLKRRYGARLKA